MERSSWEAGPATRERTVRLKLRSLREGARMPDQLSAVTGVRASTSLMTVLQLPMNERPTHFRLQVGIKKRAVEAVEAVCHPRSTHKHLFQAMTLLHDCRSRGAGSAGRPSTL